MSRLEKLKREAINEANVRVLNEQEEKYLVSGTKFCMFGSCRVDIKVIDKSTSEILISKGGEGKSEQEAYDNAVKEFNIGVKEKGLTLTPPPIEKLEKSN